MKVTIRAAADAAGYLETRIALADVDITDGVGRAHVVLEPGRPFVILDLHPGEVVFSGEVPVRVRIKGRMYDLKLTEEDL